MSNETDMPDTGAPDPEKPGRDDSGRFVSRKPRHVKTDDPSEWHPLARTLFSWTTGKGIGGVLFIGVLALSIVLLLADLVVEHHPKFNAEGMMGFYGFFGFAAFAFVVLMGWPLGRLLRRDENYYGDAEPDETGNGEDK